MLQSIFRLMFIGILALASPLVTAAGGVKQITGAGATFPYPLYAKWAEIYAKKNGVQVNYQSIGSGGGIQQISAKTVDFGASDAPLKPEELNGAGLMQFPTVIGGVVPVFKIAGIHSGELMLTGEILADIFLGKITQWNDGKIVALNPGLKLPAANITVVHRADGSGTTWIFTNYLSKVSSDWAQKVGNDKAVAWPVGLGGKGNEGVASYVERVEGALGYVEYAYALQNKMPHVRLQNRDGNFVEPTFQTFQAAAANADWERCESFYMVLTEQPGKFSWPITGATFILVHKRQDNAEKGRAVLSYFDWAYRNGGKVAEQLDYVPLPESVVKLVEEAWRQQVNDSRSNPVWGSGTTR